MNNSTLAKISRRLKALSDPTRIKIITLLASRSCCVCELATILGLAQPTISRHLKQLEFEGFISGKRDKNWIIYSLDPKEECCQKLLSILINKALEDDEIKHLKKKLNSIQRNSLTKDNKKENV